MIATIIILAQLTLFLLVVIGLSILLQRNASQAHRVLLTGFAGLILLPLLSISFATYGMGLFPIAQPNEDLSVNAAVVVPAQLPTVDARKELESGTNVTGSLVTNDSITNDQASLFPTTPEQLPKNNANAASSTHSHPIANTATTVSTFAAEFSWYHWLTVAWLTLSAFFIVRLIIGFVVAIRIKTNAIPTSDDHLVEALVWAKERLEFDKPIRLCESEEINCPVVSVWGTPHIIVPTSHKEKPLEWRSIFVHELAHLKRRDGWSALVAEATRCALPWHPLVHLCCNRMYRLSEVACDMWAVKFGGQAEAYAESLLELSPVKPRLSLASMANDPSNMAIRVKRLLSGDSPNPQSSNVFNLGLSLFVVAAVVTTSLLQTYEYTQVLNANETALTPEGSPSPEDAHDEDDESEISDGEWIERLVNVPKNSPWYVGKNLGVQLAQMKGSRGFQILSDAWENIPADVRQQILKGYYPDTRINADYYRVMDLGMNSDDSGVVEFATSYLKETAFRDFTNDAESYKAWYKTTLGMSANEVLTREIKSLVAQAKDPETRNVREFQKRFQRNPSLLATNPTATKTLLESGIVELLEEWATEGLIERDDAIFKLAQGFKKGTTNNNQTEGLAIDIASSESDWQEYLTSIPANSRWFVGANAGIAMSSMQGEKALSILTGCWSSIPASVRCQILKGFTPGFGAAQCSTKYIEILELGIKSEEPTVRQFASSYLERIAFTKITNGKQFDLWRNAHQGKTFDELMSDTCKNLMDEIRKTDATGLEAKLKQASDLLNSSDNIKMIMMEQGLPELLAERIKKGEVTLDHTATISAVLAMNLSYENCRQIVKQGLEKLTSDWEAIASTPNQVQRLNLWGKAMNLAKFKDPHSIPSLIGIIDADNQYETVYGLGYFGLSKLTAVPYSPTHDGAWWRRWWNENQHKFPESAQQIPIPELTKSPQARSYVPFPENMDTYEGAVAWMLDKHRKGENIDPALNVLSELNKDSRAIPVLIGIMDSDNSSSTISNIGRALRQLTGVSGTALSDGPWWREWWEKNKSKYPPVAQAVPIPSLPKTEFGKTYVSLSKELATTDNKIQFLMDENLPNDRRSRIIRTFSDHRFKAQPEDIPKLIGIIDSDNSYQTIYGVGYYGLSEITGVAYSSLHDGAWWKRWWDKKKAAYPKSVQEISIPTLPKTANGKTHRDYPIGLDTFEGKIEALKSISLPKDDALHKAIIDELGREPEFNDTYIPQLIGVIDSDNSRRTIHGIGSQALDSTGVRHNPIHDGAWWRRWWERNKTNYSKAAQATEIPVLPKTPFGKSYQPISSDIDSFDGMLEWVSNGCSGMKLHSEHIGSMFVETKNKRAIPVVIGWMLAEGNTNALRFTDEEFSELTGMEVVKEQTPQWWADWWKKNKTNFSKNAQRQVIPDFAQAFKVLTSTRSRKPQEASDSEFAGIPSTRFEIGESKQDALGKKEYFQIGPNSKSKQPKNGWKLLLILPGGSGSADFNPWCRRIHKNALPDGYVAIQVIAPVWSTNDDRVVWPTRKLNPDKAKFTTERFIRDIVDDVKNRLTIDESKVFAMSWSSSGPAVYANSVATKSPVVGSFVAMSVFHPKTIPNIKKAKGHAYYILHSPQDWIKIDQHARVAETELRKNGATTILKTYQGGHGWQEDPFGNIRMGIAWLEANAKPKKKK